MSADVVPCFTYHRYDALGSQYHRGIQLQADSGVRIENWPEQSYERGVTKNGATGRRYKRVVRILRSEKRADKDDRDLFGLHMNQAVMNSVGLAAAVNVSYEIVEVGGGDLRRVHVTPSRFPVEARVTRVDGRGQHRKKVAFYGRFGNATRPLTNEAELERYKQQIWGP